MGNALKRKNRCLGGGGAPISYIIRMRKDGDGANLRLHGGVGGELAMALTYPKLIGRKEVVNRMLHA